MLNNRQLADVFHFIGTPAEKEGWAFSPSLFFGLLSPPL